MSQPDAPPVTVVRGSPLRITDHMEAFQNGYLRAVVAAAGCVVVGIPEIDEGIDLQITHRSEQHRGDGVSRLEIQMKATAAFAGVGVEHLTVQVSQQNYNYLASPNPTMHKIVVILSMPKEQESWMTSTSDALLVRHCAYWVNLAGQRLSEVNRPSIAVPVAQVFDDIVLCGIMERIGQGGTP